MKWGKSQENYLQDRWEQNRKKTLVYSFRLTWLCNQLQFLKNIKNSNGTQTMVMSKKLSSSHNGNPWSFQEQQHMPHAQKSSDAHCVLSSTRSTFIFQSVDTLHIAVSCKQQQKWNYSKWQTHYNATAQLVRQLLDKYSVPKLRQSPYSPDLTSWTSFIPYNFDGEVTGNSKNVVFWWSFSNGRNGVTNI